MAINKVETVAPSVVSTTPDPFAAIPFKLRNWALPKEVRAFPPNKRTGAVTSIIGIGTFSVGDTPVTFEANVYKIVTPMENGKQTSIQLSMPTKGAGTFSKPVFEIADPDIAVKSNDWRKAMASSYMTWFTAAKAAANGKPLLVAAAQDVTSVSVDNALFD